MFREDLTQLLSDDTTDSMVGIVHLADGPPFIRVAVFLHFYSSNPVEQVIGVHRYNILLDALVGGVLKSRDLEGNMRGNEGAILRSFETESVSIVVVEAGSLSCPQIVGAIAMTFEAKGNLLAHYLSS